MPLFYPAEPEVFIKRGKKAGRYAVKAYCRGNIGGFVNPLSALRIKLNLNTNNQGRKIYFKNGIKTTKNNELKQCRQAMLRYISSVAPAKARKKNFRDFAADRRLKKPFCANFRRKRKNKDISYAAPKNKSSKSKVRQKKVFQPLAAFFTFSFRLLRIVFFLRFFLRLLFFSTSLPLPRRFLLYSFRKRADGGVSAFYSVPR